MRYLAIVVAALAFTGAAAADTTYTDATGENSAAADISTINVTNDPVAHTFTIAVQIANMTTLEPNAEIDILFDSDRNASTGDQGFDYLFFVDSGGWGFAKWDGTQFSRVTGLNLDVRFASGLMTATFHETDIAATGGFAFGVLTFRGPDPQNPVLDQAPDSGPLYDYTFAAAPVAKPATVSGSTVTVSGAPKHGARFVVGPFQVNLSDGTSANATGMKCTATLGGARLKGTGAGGCAFALPKTAKGKKLAVTVAGTYGGTVYSKTLKLVVK